MKSVFAALVCLCLGGPVWAAPIPSGKECPMDGCTYSGGMCNCGAPDAGKTCKEMSPSCHAPSPTRCQCKLVDKVPEPPTGGGAAPPTMAGPQ